MELAARGVEGEKGSGCNGQVSEIKTHSRLPNRAYSAARSWEPERGNIAHACSSFTPSRSMLETDD